MSLIPDEKPEEIEFLPLGDKERGDRLEAMVDRMSETIVNLKSELAEYKELYDDVAKKLNSANYLVSQIASLVKGSEGGRTLLAADVLITCEKCGQYHSIYVACDGANYSHAAKA